MNKKIGYVVIGIIIITLAVLLYSANRTGNKATVDNHPKNTDNTQESVYQESVVDELFKLAEAGKMRSMPFVVGSAKLADVSETWGEPEKANSIGTSLFVEYPDYAVTFEYENGTLVDMRSFQSEVGQIHLNEITEAKGAPDKVRYYKDEFVDQIVLTYSINPFYELKWFSPRPSEQENNPRVHHVSLGDKRSTYEQVRMTSDEMIETMSLDEKIGQMIIVGITGASIDSNARSLLVDDKVGGLILYAENMKDPRQLITLQNAIRDENSPNRIPLLIGVDQEGGRTSRLPKEITKTPSNGLLGEINNTEFSYEVGTILGRQLNAFGFNLNFAPVLDINSNPKNPVIGDRAFGNDVEVVSRLGIQTMKGIQSQNVIPVIKHFPGHGDTAVDSHLDLPKVNKALVDLRTQEIIPFEQAIIEGAEVIMIAHILLPKIDATFPSSMSKSVITDVLRNDLGFDGVVMTDDMTMNAIIKHYDIGRAAVESVKAGSDIIMVAHDYQKMKLVVTALRTAAQNGELPKERINASVKRIIELKREYGVTNRKMQHVNVESMNAETFEILNTYVK